MVFLVKSVSRHRSTFLLWIKTRPPWPKIHIINHPNYKQSQDWAKVVASLFTNAPSQQIVFFASLWLRHFLKNTETELVLRWGGLPPIYQDKQQQRWNKNILLGNTLQHKQDQICLDRSESWSLIPIQGPRGSNGRSTGQGGGLRCSIRSTVTIDGSGDHL